MSDEVRNCSTLAEHDASRRNSIELRRAVFLDRDGTLNEDPGYVHRVEGLRLLDGVVEGLLALHGAGFVLVIVTNQAGVAKGVFGEEAMNAFNAALVAQLAIRGVRILDVYCCPFHPDGTVEKYRSASPDRKPEPGMLLAAAREHRIDLSCSFMIGDKLSDVGAGKRAGCRSILISSSSLAACVETPDAASEDGAPDFVADSFASAAEWTLRVASTSACGSHEG